MAVLFYIHGGFGQYGSGAEDGPQRLMGNDIVLVTTNYRLGAFGFLSTEDGESPGNYGLLDQLEALKWVKEHIKRFSGNPSRITLFGHSFGSASVFYHILSPSSTGLFYAAITASGSAYSDRYFDPNPMNPAKRLADKVGCPTNSTKSLIACLKSVSKETIVVATENMTTSGVRNGIVPFRPVADGWYSGSFIPDEPKVVLRTGIYNHVPIMSGVTKDEGLFYYLALSKVPKNATNLAEAFTIDAFEEIMPTLVPEFYRKVPVSEEWVGVNMTDILFKYYFRGDRMETTRGIVNGILEGTSDLAQNYFVDFTNFVFSIGNERVYVYRISYGGPETPLWKLLPGSQFVPTDQTFVSHGDELQFLFSHNETDFVNADDRKMSDVMVNLWTSFAKNKEPSLPGDELIPLMSKWQTLRSGRGGPNILDINPSPFMLNDYLILNNNMAIPQLLKSYYLNYNVPYCPKDFVPDMTQQRADANFAGGYI
ncbi:hypothetical protein CHUAL_001653 [Chamberlinius hualienensis]